MKTSKYTTAHIIELMHKYPNGATIRENGQTIVIPSTQTAGTGYQNISYQVSTARKIAKELNEQPEIVLKVR